MWLKEGAGYRNVFGMHSLNSLQSVHLFQAITTSTQLPVTSKRTQAVLPVSMLLSLTPLVWDLKDASRLVTPSPFLTMSLTKPPWLSSSVQMVPTTLSLTAPVPPVRQLGIPPPITVPLMVCETLMASIPSNRMLSASPTTRRSTSDGFNGKTRLSSVVKISVSAVSPATLLTEIITMVSSLFSLSPLLTSCSHVLDHRHW